MKVKVVKVADKKWDVLVNGEVIGQAKYSSKYDGSYEIELPNGKVINAVSQDALKRMVAKYI